MTRTTTIPKPALRAAAGCLWPWSCCSSWAAVRLAEGVARGNRNEACRAMVWEIPNPAAKVDVEIPKINQNAVALSPDGKTLAVGGLILDPKSNSGLRFLDAATGMELSTVPDMNAVSSLSFSPDGKFLAASNFVD